MPTTIESPPPRNQNGHPMNFKYAPESTPLEGFTIKRAIQRGGFGEVYYALSDAGKEVAIKLLRDNLDIELRGVNQCLNLKHPNLLTIFDVKQSTGGEHWIVMEYMSGQTLDQLLAQHPTGLPQARIEAVLNDVVAGVSYLHEQGIVHRDLKPANIFVEPESVKLGDVGLSKFISTSRRSAHTESVGTVYYMAPEIAHGRYGREVDVYALGVILFEMLTGKVPFDGESTGEILMKQLTQPPNLGALPAALRSVVGRALEKDPLKRTQTAALLASEFRAAVHRPATPPKPEWKPAARVRQPVLEAAEAFEADDTDESRSIPWYEQDRLAWQVAIVIGRVFGIAGVSLILVGFLVPIPIGLTRWNFLGPASMGFLIYGGVTLLHSQFSKDSQRRRRHRHAADDARHSPWHEQAGLTRMASVGTGRAFGVAAVVGIVLVTLFLIRSGASRWDLTAFASIGLMIYGGVTLFRHLLSNNAAHRRHAEQSAPRARQLNPRYQRNCGPETVRFMSPAQRAADVTGAMAVAALCAALVTVVLMSFQTILKTPSQAMLFALTTTFGAWAAMLPAKLWEGRATDGAGRRITTAIAGMCAGAGACVVDQSLRVGFYIQDFSGLAMARSVFQSPLTGPDSRMVSYAMFFGTLLLVRRWWFHVDAYREKRLRLTSVFWTTAASFVIAEMFDFPTDWAVMWGLSISATAQLASAWVAPEQRGTSA